MTTIKLTIYGLSSMFLLSSTEIGKWAELGVLGVFLLLFFKYVVKPMTEAHIQNSKDIAAAVKTNGEAMTEAIEKMTAVITDLRIDFNKHSDATNKRLDDIEEEIKKIKDKA